jgi:hypothetical protein
MPMPTKETDNRCLTPRHLTLTPEAKACWIRYHDSIESELGPDGSIHGIKSFANKAPEHALRISGTLTLVENPTACEISLDSIENAIDIMDYYIEESLRLLGASSIDPELEQAQQLLDWIQKLKDTAGAPASEVYLSQVYQYGPGSIRDAKTAKRLIAIVESHGWIMRIKGGKEIEGVHRKDVWAICRASKKGGAQ